MKPLLFFHHLWLWKDSDNLLGDVCVCVCVCVCVLGGGGVHIMYLCKIWGGSVFYSAFWNSYPIDFCCSKEQNTVYVTHSQTHPW